MNGIAQIARSAARSKRAPPVRQCEIAHDERDFFEDRDRVRDLTLESHLWRGAEDGIVPDTRN